MRTVIVGLGSIGSRHLKNLKSIAPDTYVTIWHQKKTRSTGDENIQLVDDIVYNLKDAIAKQPNMAIISNPSPFHIETATQLAREGIHLLIEKPLSNNLNGVDELIDLCYRKGVVLLVGYNLRFYAPTQVMYTTLRKGQIGRILSIRVEVGQYLPDWRLGTDYRESVSARFDLGGGVLLELSHELDYVHWLVGEIHTVNAQVARLGNLDIDVEDTAELILGFRNGAIGSVHLDMIQRTVKRSCYIIGTEGTLNWEKETGQVRLFSLSSKKWEVLYTSDETDGKLMYIDELKHFIDCVNGKASPLISAQDGRRIIEIVNAAKKSSHENRTIQL